MCMCEKGREGSRRRRETTVDGGTGAARLLILKVAGSRRLALQIGLTSPFSSGLQQRKREGARYTFSLRRRTL